MSDIAIQVESLGKQYRIGQSRKAQNFREALTAAALAPLRRLRQPLNPAGEHTFWALKDVSFQVKRGEVVGIIGRNGAGKSTLLKVLSRITEPTEGLAVINGRVSSLLEVGTGFHPELTGRENIFLNGAILGMKRAEINRKFEEIVAFAETEKFLDTPVKHYSSGMYMRLAFAVAAHLDPEILIVDEVLAVGDASFQKKCLGKMGDVARSGRTVIFVSHNMQAVRTLCTHGVVLKNGCVDKDDQIDASVDHYLAITGGGGSGVWERESFRPRANLEIQQISCELEGNQPRHRLTIQVELESRAAHKPAFIAFDVISAGTCVMQALPVLHGIIRDASRRHRLRATVELPPIIPGHYFLTVWVGSHNTETLDLIENAVQFEVVQSPTPGRTFPHAPEHGHVVPPATVECLDL